MNLNLLTLLNELKKYYDIRSFGHTSENISDIKKLPSGVDINLFDDVLYVTTEKTPEALEISAPLLLVVPPGTEVDGAVLSTRSIIVLYSDDLPAVLLTLSKIMYERGQGGSELSEFSKRLLRCKNIQEMLDVGFSVIKKPIIVANPRQRIIACTDSGVILSPGYGRIVAGEFLPASFTTSEQASVTYEESVHSAYPVCMPGGSILRKVLDIGGRVEGYLHVFDSNGDFSDRDFDIVEILGNFIVYYLIRRNTDDRDANFQISIFLKELLDTGITNVKDAHEYLAGCNIGDYMRVMVVHPGRYGIQKNISVHRLSEILASSMPACFGMLYKNDIILLLESDKEPRECHEEFKPLAEMLSKHGLTAGVSNLFRSASNFRQCYIQALKASVLGPPFFKDSVLHPYEKCAVYHVIELSSAQCSLENFISPILRRLIEHDAETNGDLVKTLRVFLKNGNKTETAKELFVHLNTVKYRLSHIEDFLKINLSEFEFVNELNFSFKILEYMEAFPDSRNPYYFDAQPIAQI